MEDDIDIEEHDVLDNPKIRDIFPDLSLVKIEVPDEEDPEDLYEDYTPELRYDEFDIKQENLSDNDNTTNNYEQNEQISQSQQSDTSNFDQNNQSAYQIDEDLTQNNIQDEQNGQIEQIEQTDTSTQFSNKIILGTKVIDYDVLYTEALNSNTKVRLENWEYKLKTSQCYCEDCEILFPTVNALDAHNSISHSLLVALDAKSNTARKSTVTTSSSSTYCNHCDKTFPNDTALITHLYKLLPLSNYQKPPEDNENFMYKCVKCVKYFDTYNNASRHKKLAHPQLSNVNAIVKVPKVPNKTVPSKTTLENKYGKFFASSNLVPKSVVFQCNICQVGFVSCYSALQHSRKCEKKTVFEKCRVCKRKIRSKDIYVHSLQHKYTDKLKIYTINKTIHERVLLKCPKCNICYDEKTFWLHEKNCQGTQPNYFRCNICSINIISNRYESHKNNHDSKKYAKKDYIFVEFYDKNEIDIRGDVKDNSSKLDEKDTTLYYCSCCGSYKTNSTLIGHIYGSCKQLKVIFCPICGLGFGRKTYYEHKMLHKAKKIELNDFKIFSLETGEPMDTPMSNFHYCENCMIHFLTHDALSLHTCVKERFILCEICNKKFSLKAFKPHSGFHTLEGLPEMLKKYNSMDSMWNVIYSCEECQLVTMSYDSTVEHSQAHINDIVFPSSNYCKICDFYLLEKDLEPHMILHENNETLNRNEFTVLKYDYKNLFNPDWMTMMATLPKQHKYQILSKSIYRYCRRFKINCEIDCEADEMKLYCNKCKKLVNMADMKQHYASTCKYSTKYTCSICELEFKTISECVKHESEHYAETKIFKVLTYNDESDEIFNQKLRDFNNPTINAKSNKNVKTKFAAKLKTKIVTKKVSKLSKKIKFKDVKIKFDSVKSNLETHNRFKLYKCEVCNSCLSIRKNVYKHKCVTDESKQRLCRICNELFYSRYLHLHMSYHTLYPKFNKYKPLVINFHPKKSLSIATIYQCKCGINFTTRQAIDNHLKVCNGNMTISKETCSKCNLDFPTDMLVSHLCKHHSKTVDIKIEKMDIVDNVPHKCVVCKVVYQNINSYEDHLFRCPVKNGKLCRDCGNVIDHNSFSDHKCEKNVVSVKYNGVATMLYRCPTCDVNYLYKNSFCYHLNQNHLNFREIVTCDLCDLRFNLQILNKHKSLMHFDDDNYIVKLFESETEQFTIIKSNNYKLDFKKSTEVKEKVATKRVIDETLVTPEPSTDSSDGSMAYGKVWKCTTCDICYSTKKRWYYHVTVINHITTHKREVLPCDVCGLRFYSQFLEKHKQIHEIDDTYKIEVIDGQTNKFEIITGKNNINPNKKRKFDSIESPVSSKKAKTDLIDQKPGTSKWNVTDYTSNRRAKKRESFADRSPSNIDFETVDMEEDTAMLSDVDAADPLNSSVECLTDSMADQTISNKLQNLLNSKIDAYSNTLYECAKCHLHFMTVKTAIGHISKYCGRKMTTNKCNICKRNFTWKTLPIHKYVHHTKMKLTPELLNIELVNDGDKPYAINRKSINHTINEKSKIISDTMSDVDATDPLNSSVECLTDSFADKTISNKLQNLLNSKIDAYSNTLYECANCHLHFMTLSSAFGHQGRDCGRDMVSYKCDICARDFTWKTYPRHKYIHHTKMNLTPELLNIELVTEADKPSWINRKSMNDTINDKSKILSDTISDVDVTDPLNSSVECLNNSFTISNKLQNLLNAKFDAYSNTLYECAKCHLHFMTVKSASGHISKYCGRKMSTYKCNICNRNFTWKTLPRHKYVHHTTMKLTSELLNIELVNDGDKSYPINRKSINDTINEQSKIISDTMSDVDAKDPLNSSVECLTDSIADGTISDKLQNLLNANFDAYSNTLYECAKCHLHFMTMKSVSGHMSNYCGRDMITYKCDICARDFTWKTYPRHKYVHHTKMKLTPELLNIELVNVDEKPNPINRKSTNDTINEKSKINYYKCADCNVCFVDEKACRKHCICHSTLDPRDYIECKICNFQFLIEHLKKHVDMHHEDEFFIEDLVITEYKATQDRHPKIVIYRGIDKVQSRLISTTTETQADNTVGDIIGI